MHKCRLAIPRELRDDSPGFSSTTRQEVGMSTKSDDVITTTGSVSPPLPSDHKIHLSSAKMVKGNQVNDLATKFNFQKASLTSHEFYETCHSVTFIVLVNSHQR